MMKGKWIVRLIVLLLAAIGVYALSTSTARSEKQILRAEFSVPPGAELVRYSSAPQTGLIPWPREGLDIEMAFQFVPNQYQEYVAAAESQGNWQPLPFPKDYFPAASPKFTLSVDPASGLFQCRTAGTDIMHAPKTIRTDLGNGVNDLMIGILDHDRHQLIIKVVTGY
jgi:hypothetical protein